MPVWRQWQLAADADTTPDPITNAVGTILVQP
jgi:hypothetical protein